MKPYNREFLLNKIDEYNKKINIGECGAYKIIKRDGLQGIIEGYLYEMEDNINTEIPELWGDERVWMRLSPMEIQGTYQFLKLAEGRVGVVGLGLGYTVQELAKKKEVSEVIVYEISEEVIKLYNKNFKKNKKIKIIKGDAFLEKGENFDWFFVDIYEYKITNNMVDDFKHFMEAHTIENYAFFGVEAFLLSCAFEDVKWVFIPENWMELVQVLYKSFEGSEYFKYKKTLDEKVVYDILMGFKKVLNEE